LHILKLLLLKRERTQPKIQKCPNENAPIKIATFIKNTKKILQGEGINTSKDKEKRSGDCFQSKTARFNKKPSPGVSASFSKNAPARPGQALTGANSFLFNY